MSILSVVAALLALAVLFFVIKIGLKLLFWLLIGAAFLAVMKLVGILLLMV